MNSSYTTTNVETTPNRKATTTVSKYEYSKTNLGNEVMIFEKMFIKSIGHHTKVLMFFFFKLSLFSLSKSRSIKMIEKQM